MRSPALVVLTACSTTPMLDVMSSSWVPTWNGVDSVACTFSASSITSVMEVVSSRRITNSSPPMRATVRSGQHRSRLAAMQISSSSPWWWPSVSFTVLKPSRSR